MSGSDHCGEFLNWRGGQVKIQYNQLAWAHDQTSMIRLQLQWQCISESESESLYCHCTKCNEIGVEALKISAFKQKLNEKMSVFFENKFRMLNSKKNIYTF